MRFSILLLLLPTFIFTQNTVPADYVVKSLKVDENNHVFLKFNTNTSTSIEQSGWDIALYNETHEIGGRINETKGVKVWRVYQDTTQFSSISLTDTLNPFYNNDSFYYLGALDTIYTGSTQTFFRIGLGRFYFDAGYSAVANRIYIIKNENGSFGKFHINYSNRVFTIRYANIDNTNDKRIQITKIVPLAKHSQYINLTSGSVSNNYEVGIDEWDVVLKKYWKGTTSYPLGILTNNSYNLIRYSKFLNAFVEDLPETYLKYGIVSTECYEAMGDPQTVQYNGTLSTMEPISRLNNQIGEKWYNAATQLPIQNKSYFLRDKSGRLWHLIFTNYNSSTNTIDIAFKDKGQVASISNFRQENDLLILQSDNTLSIENMNPSKEKHIFMYNIQGKKIKEIVLKNKLEMDVSLYKNSIIFINSHEGDYSRGFKLFVR